MSEFFHGWRRKAGCGFLMLALMLTVGWFRSHYDQDNVTVYRDQESYVVHSRDGRLYWMRDQISYGRFELWSTSYWSIVAPLTVLSAFLILWKPRKRRVAGPESHDGFTASRSRPFP